VTEWEQKGYDAWIEYWTHYGFTPTASNCPARSLKEGPERAQYIRGWVKAKNEHEATTT
jgi:hypothetical protein